MQAFQLQQKEETAALPTELSSLHPPQQQKFITFGCKPQLPSTLVSNLYEVSLHIVACLATFNERFASFTVSFNKLFLYGCLVRNRS